MGKCKLSLASGTDMDFGTVQVQHCLLTFILLLFKGLRVCIYDRPLARGRLEIGRDDLILQLVTWFGNWI